MVGKDRHPLNMGAGVSSTVFLTAKEFPPEFENVYCARSQSPKQNSAAEKVMITGADRRERIKEYDPKAWRYPDIGLLRIEFNGTVFTGTASIIHPSDCLLTCAHNVVDYDETTKEFVYPTGMWFELRKNKAGSGSVLVKRYQVTKIAVYPQYFENPTSASGFDLALCWIHVPKNDHTVEDLHLYSNNDCLVKPLIPVSGGYFGGYVAVVGFPGEHAGEKWGMVVQIPSEKIEDWKFPAEHKTHHTDKREILVYNFIDTSPGQSGSPVIGFGDGCILGVHTGGSASLKKNWATYITPTKLRWIAKCMGKVVDYDWDTLYIPTQE